ncbi:hypothetical protein [Brucella gallinifaecis]|uniref:hypothetical protein n=1 Tax=Brucella gallinifaecis TaxID=215590 RepID=UPI00235E4449|nr:hypothetical protein [Brucella gallinifaecis]
MTIDTMIGISLAEKRSQSALSVDGGAGKIPKKAIEPNITMRPGPKHQSYLPYQGARNPLSAGRLTALQTF